MIAAMVFFDFLPVHEGVIKFCESTDTEYFRVGYRADSGIRSNVKIRDSDWPDGISELNKQSLLMQLAKLMKAQGVLVEIRGNRMARKAECAINL